jgi:hypothetical protein
MQAVNASAAETAMPLTTLGRHDSNDSKLSHLRRRNSRKFKIPYSIVNLVVE